MNIETLKKHFPLLCTSVLLMEIDKHCQIKTFAEGEELMKYGQAMKFVPLILAGTLKVMREDESGREVLLYFLEAGDTCAMSITCCMSQRKSAVRAIVEEETQILMVPLFKSEEWMAKYADWRNFILKSYAVRMEELLNALDSIAFRSLDERLERYLQEKHKVTGANEFSITHGEIAMELNSSREAISRLLKKMEGLGKVRLSRNKVKWLA